MVDINEAKERFAQLLEGQRKRVAAMRAQGDFVDYDKLDKIVKAGTDCDWRVRRRWHWPGDYA